MDGKVKNIAGSFYTITLFHKVSKHQGYYSYLTLQPLASANVWTQHLFSHFAAARTVLCREMSFTPPESTKSRTAAVQKMDSTFIQSAMSHVAHWLLLFPALSDLLSSFAFWGPPYIYFQWLRREVLSEMSPLSSNWEHSWQKCAATKHSWFRFLLYLATSHLFQVGMLQTPSSILWDTRKEHRRRLLD